jgi:hypothetical protein
MKLTAAISGLVKKAKRAVRSVLDHLDRESEEFERVCHEREADMTTPKKRDDKPSECRCVGCEP